MKFTFFIAALGAFFIILVCSGCTSSTQRPPETITPAPVMTTLPVPTSVPVPAGPYPDALTAGQYATFGSGNKLGNATVFKYEIRPEYTWTAPSFNSPREQAASSQPNEMVTGYNLAKPDEGDAFLFIYIRVINNGNTAIYAPSASQFVVISDGKVFNYTPVHGPDVVIDKVSGTQYDYQIGRGGEVGYVQPGESNRAEGYLIYEVPAAIPLQDTYVVANLDYRNQAVWKLG
ncbi:MAG: DUF4352 domain-containing protein [Methanoregula sp.]|nr:DUF4352 domain-containing protein [Methanoregula sp.]